MNSAVFDIETTSLGAVGAGIVMCVCVRPLHTARTRVFRIDQYEFPASDDFGFLERQEKALLADVNEELLKYHILIGHNIIKFDMPYLISRAYQWGMKWEGHPVLYDTMTGFRRTSYLTMPNLIGKPSAGLDAVADFAQIQQEKTKIYPNEWWAAVWKKKAQRTAALDEIVDHCQRDVRMNASVFEFVWAADKKPQLVKAG